MASDNVQSGHFSGVPESSLGGFVAIFKILRKYAAMVIACVILSGGGTLLYSRSMPKVYQASTLIEMNPRANQPLGDSASGTFDIGAGLFWDPTEYYQTQYKLISSGAVLTAAVEKLSLQTDDDFLGYPPESKHDPISAADVAGMLAQRINVDPIKGTRLFFLRASDTDPKRSKRIADAVASVYIDQNLQAAISSSSEAVAWLDGQIDHIKGELEVDENALYAFKQRNNLPSISINDSSNSMRQEMEAFDQALTKTRMLKAELQARKAELGTVSPDNPDAVASSELLSNAYLQSLRGAYLKAAADRSALISQGKGENHPQVKEADARLVDAKKALLTEVANIQDATGRDLAVVEHEERSELALFLDARHAAVDLNMKEIEYHRLDRTREQDEKLYGLLLERMKAADLARMLRANNLRVVETAGIPDTPIRPRISTNVGVGLLAGFLIGFALAWVREQLDSSIKTPDDLEQKLGLVFLGLLPELEGSGRRSRAGPTRRRAGAPAPRRRPTRSWASRWSSSCTVVP
jgi:succinoglycan biosynthesis transport protein ExoP